MARDRVDEALRTAGTAIRAADSWGYGAAGHEQIVVALRHLANAIHEVNTDG